jgi:hypothetical protein
MKPSPTYDVSVSVSNGGTEPLSSVDVLYLSRGWMDQEQHP